MYHLVFYFQERLLQSVLKQLTVILKAKSGGSEWFMAGISTRTANTFSYGRYPQVCCRLNPTVLLGAIGMQKKTKDCYQNRRGF